MHLDASAGMAETAWQECEVVKTRANDRKTRDHNLPTPKDIPRRVTGLRPAREIRARHDTRKLTVYCAVVPELTDVELAVLAPARGPVRYQPSSSALLRALLIVHVGTLPQPLRRLFRGNITLRLGKKFKPVRGQ